ncbi:MAG: translation initiation factor IF-2 [Gordonibacter pamelaeae]
MGAISETDVTLAAASDAIIIGFGVRPSTKAGATQAEREGVQIKTYFASSIRLSTTSTTRPVWVCSSPE